MKEHFKSSLPSKRGKKLTQEEFLEKVIECHGHKYDYSKTLYTKATGKIIIICPEHGEFIKVANDHMRGANCPYCVKLSFKNKKGDSLDDFIKKSKEKHGNKYDYSKTIYVNSRTKVNIRCSKHGEFSKTPANHLNGQGCPKCSKEEFVPQTNPSDLKKLKEDFVKKAIKIHGNKYIYINSNYVSSKKHIVINCPKHGDFIKIPSEHLGGSGCAECKKETPHPLTYTTEKFISIAKEVHGDKYDYSKTIYKNSRTDVIIICPEHGEFLKNSQFHLSGSGCFNCSSTESKPESEIKNFIDAFNISYKNNCRQTISPKELDVYIPDLNIAIEMNGNYYHSELFGKPPNYHLEKTKDCEERGIQLIHVFESEWINNKELIKSMIKAKIGKNHRIFARNCKIVEVSNSNKNDFLVKNHIQGKDNSGIRYGLYHDGELVSIMTFLKSRFNKKYEMEISRFASKQGITVVGGASKLFKHFIKTHNPSSVISYSNKRFSQGNLYKQMGFEHLYDSKPNYFYFNVKSPYVLLSRQQFQKHKLERVLETFDPELTEWENMKNNGYNRIWDCGNGAWGWKKINFEISC